MFDNDTVRSWKDPDEPVAFDHPVGGIDLGSPSELVTDPFGPLVDWALSWLLACSSPGKPL